MSRQALLLLTPFVLLVRGVLAQGVTDRIPAVPLIVHDPYFSIWSFDDSLAHDWPRHWTGKANGMSAILRVDGRGYRLMGREPRGLPVAEELGRVVTPTRTTYLFSCGGVRLEFSFLSPQLIQDADALSRPVTYLGWDLRAKDSLDHSVEIYFDITAEATVNSVEQPVVWGRFALPGLQVLRIGSQSQPVLQKQGDDLRIDWGYLYLAAEERPNLTMRAGGDRETRSQFVRSGTLPPEDDLRCPRAANDHWPVLACVQSFPRLGMHGERGGIVLAYDDLFGIQYLHRDLRPYWRHDGLTPADLLRQAVVGAESLRVECGRFDREFLHDALECGGEDYQLLATLAYRQCLAANKVVADVDGKTLMFPKENFSNGCIGTVDVIYPASPLFLLFNPALLEAQLTPVLFYAALPRWKFPFAPHDLGTYPRANGQVYGGGELTEENQMPVEESGNMLLMVAGVSVAERSARFALEHWPVLQRWAEYLRAKGFDPENQLCTDDFAGHLAHNVNLSAKAILALGAYGRLCEMAGKAAEAKRYRELAQQYAQDWVRFSDDGDHSRLAFDQPGTWSQKYNLIWDAVLGLNLFPPEVAHREIQFLLAHQNRYGLPLDSRASYTKLDWILWTASLAPQEADFDSLIAPVARFLRETPDRVPMSDWYSTTTARKIGFQARSVVGGVLIRMLLDRSIVSKWQAHLAGRP